MQRKKQSNLLLWAMTLGLSALLVVWLFASLPASAKDSPSCAEGMAFLEAQEAKDPEQVAQSLRERERKRREEEIAARKAQERAELIRQIESGEVDIWSLFEDYVILGDSRAVGFYYFDFLDENRVLAGGGDTIRNVALHMEEIKTLNPAYVFLCYGLNDVSIGYWDTPEEYAAEFLTVIQSLREELPGVTVVVSSILPARDPAFELSSKWRNIPQFSEAVARMCQENGIVFSDNDEISEEYADWWQPDGIHVRPEFYPYWATDLILTSYDAPTDASAGDTTLYTRGDAQ